PIDTIVLPQYEVHDIRAVIAMPELNKCFGPDQFGRSHDPHARTQHLDARRVLEPCVGHRLETMPRGKDHIEKVLALEDLAEPTLILHLDRVARAAEMGEDAGIIARLAKDIEILGCAPN